MFVDINGQQISCTTSLGFPQGGVCSAKFGIIAFNAAVSILNKHGVQNGPSSEAVDSDCTENDDPLND